MAKSNILGNVLKGVGTGFLRHQTERKKQQAEQEKYKTIDSRRAEQNARDEAKRQTIRAERKQDEQSAYDTKQTRLKEYQLKTIKEIATLYPDRVKDPAFQREVEASVKGFKIPSQPTNMKIADLYMSGNRDEAIKLAMKSSNPADKAFVKDMDSFEKAKFQIDRLKNPSKYRAPSALEAVSGSLPTMSTKEKQNYKDRLRLKDEEIKDLEYAIDHSDASEARSRMEKKLESLKKNKNFLRKQYSDKLEGRTSAGAKGTLSTLLKKFMQMQKDKIQP